VREGVVRIGILLGRSFTDRSDMPEVLRLLKRMGATGKLLHLGDDLIDVAWMSLDYDLYVLREKSDLAMSVAADLHSAGAALLNPYPVSTLLRDRVVTFRVLRAAGVRVPETFVASHVSQLLPALDRGPLIIRPHRRSRKQDVQVVGDAAELERLGSIEEPVFAQRYLPPDEAGPDRKIYSIGGELFGVFRFRPARTYEEKQGRPFALSSELVDIARRCGAAFGIDLFGVDVVESGGKAYVVDVSSFPSFRGVPDGPLRVARYVHAAAERVARGEPIVPSKSPVARPAVAPGGLKGSAVEVVLQALSRAPATPHELDQIQELLDDMRVRASGAPASVPSGRARPRSAPARDPSAPRVAMYSPGMVGFGHIRRNASIAQALRGSPLQPAIVMLAEAKQAGALPLPAGVDCVTLPGLRKEVDGCCKPRFLGVSEQDLIALRAQVIRSAIDAFAPDVLIVDHLPLGAARELTGTLELLRRRGTTRCVLGLRDVLQDPETVRRTWAEQGYVDAIRKYYDAVWIYGDPAVFDPVREYAVFEQFAAKVRYTGYLDQRARLELTGVEAGPLIANLPPGRLALCVLGGGHDGYPLAEAFVQAKLPPDTTGVVVTGLYMPWEMRHQLRQSVEGRPGFRVLDFVPEPASLIERADHVIAMGGYNTVCEVLSFEKHALIVPRVAPKPEQWIRAQRMRELGLVDVLHPDKLSPEALTEWLAREPGPPPAGRSRIDVGGLDRIPGLLDELLGASRSRVAALPALPAVPGLPAPPPAAPTRALGLIR
jgi:predicted glycosyltransferase/glutathione synthase/RimK-type ligase-like ATP-grasp enzyme